MLRCPIRAQKLLQMSLLSTGALLVARMAVAVPSSHAFSGGAREAIHVGSC